MFVIILYCFFVPQHVRRAAVLALSTAAHNKPNLIKGLLAELLPLLYDQTVVKVHFLYSSYQNFMFFLCCVGPQEPPPQTVTFKIFELYYIIYRWTGFSVVFRNLVSEWFLFAEFRFEVLSVWLVMGLRIIRAGEMQQNVSLTRAWALYELGFWLFRFRWEIFSVGERICDCYSESPWVQSLFFFISLLAERTDKNSRSRSFQARCWRWPWAKKSCVWMCGHIAGQLPGSNESFFFHCSSSNIRPGRWVSMAIPLSL